jgi:hypothetical protein
MLKKHVHEGQETSPDGKLFSRLEYIFTRFFKNVDKFK